MIHSSGASAKARLLRSPDGYLAGVCEGLGIRFGVNPSLVRLLWVVSLFFAGTGLLLYAVLWWVMPRADAQPAEPVIWTRHPDGRRTPPLARTLVDRKLLGVCGGIARRFDVDPTLVRLAALSLATASGGAVALLYVVAALALPGPHHGGAHHFGPHPAQP